MSANAEAPADWFYVEMLGHSAVAGRMREITVAGMTMLHITVPCDPPAEIIIPPTSLFRLNKIDEASARRRTVGQPAHLRVYEAPALPARATGYYTESDPFDGPSVSVPDDPRDADDEDHSRYADDEEPDPDHHYATPGSYEDVEEGDY